MENTQEQKTPEMWFQMLKEPYRSEAIKGINKEVIHFKEYPESLLDALYFSLYWTDVPNEKATRKDWGKIYNSIKAGETTYLEPETLKPEQMESGKWYVVDTRFKFLSKFKEITNGYLYEYKGYSYYGDMANGDIPLTHIDDIKLIRPATKQEVLKYFPDEVFEPIELRPEDLVSGEVYTATDGTIKRTFIFTYFTQYVHYKKLIDYNGIFKKNGCLSRGFKFYHATPEEKNLLLGEETTDWEAKYNELKSKFDQLEPKGEKVYFYFDYLDNLIKTTDFEFALHESSEDSPIYKGVFLGKKKSVLVNE